MGSTKEVDIGSQVWLSCLRLLSLHEYIFTVDHSSLWRQHLAWAKEDGAQLRNHMTQRFASSMVFMSLILSGQLMVLFNSNHLQTLMRTKMMSQSYGDPLYWIGVVITVSVFLTFFTLISNFTAWGMVSSISDNNSHCLLRSSIGLYAAQLPSRLVTLSIYSFLLWTTMLAMYILPGPYMMILFAAIAIFFFHIVAVFSSFGRLILHTGAMGSQRIFDQEFEDFLMPSGLHISLLIMALEQQRSATTVPEQYKETLSVEASETDKPPPPPTQSISPKFIPPETREGSGRKDGHIYDSFSSMDSEAIHKTVLQTIQSGHVMDSFINSESHNLHETQRTSLSRSHRRISFEDDYRSSFRIPPDQPRFATEEVLGPSHKSLRNIRQSFVSAGHSLSIKNMGEEDLDSTESSRPRSRRGILKRGSSFESSITREWENEKEARTMYSAPPPPPEPVSPIAEPLDPVPKPKSAKKTPLPSPSVLNKANLTFKSIRRVAEHDRATNSTEENDPEHGNKVNEMVSPLAEIAENKSFESTDSEHKALLEKGNFQHYTDPKN